MRFLRLAVAVLILIQSLQYICLLLQLKPSFLMLKKFLSDYQVVLQIGQILVLATMMCIRCDYLAAGLNH